MTGQYWGRPSGSALYAHLVGHTGLVRGGDRVGRDLAGHRQLRRDGPDLGRRRHPPRHPHRRPERGACGGGSRRTGPGWSLAAPTMGGRGSGPLTAPRALPHRAQVRCGCSRDATQNDEALASDRRTCTRPTTWIRSSLGLESRGGRALAGGRQGPRRSPGWTARPASWAPSPGHRFIRIMPGVVAGRRRRLARS